MMELIAASWRDAVMLVVALVGVYLVLMVMRLIRVSRELPLDGDMSPRERQAPTLLDHGAASLVEVPEPRLSVQEPDVPELADVVVDLPEAPATPSRLSALLGRQREMRTPSPERRDDSTTNSPDLRHADFSAALARSGLEAEVQQLRRESANLRQQLAGIQQELTQLKATRNVSPLYSEAVSLAQRGMTADGIASQCGISLGEAELVAALARADGDQFGTDEDGNGGHPRPGRRTGTHG